jgi:hypothetical protein
MHEKARNAAGSLVFRGRRQELAVTDVPLRALMRAANDQRPAGVIVRSARCASLARLPGTG